MSTKANTNTNENAVQPADPKKENEIAILNELSQIIISYFPNNQLDEGMINYICKMIYIERPDNENDLKNLIDDYLSDQLRYPEDKTLSICKEIFQKIQKNKIKGNRKAIIAERLQNSIRLNDIKVGSGNTITSLSFDPNALTFEMDRMYSQGIESSVAKRPEYVADKEKIKAMEAFMEEMRKQKESLEEVTIYHDKDESHKVDIIVPNFTIHIGGKTLIDDASLKISFGRRYVLIGRNGIGKTTLLNNIVRKEIDGVPKNLQIVHVEQEVIMTKNPLLNEVLLCDIERTKLIKESDEINSKLLTEKNEAELKKLSTKLVEVSKPLEDIGSGEAENKAKFILLGLGFHEKDFGTKTKDFSGGWRVRISLAKALFVMPDLLLLDEPTNHLDMNAVMWLEDYLNSWPYTLVIVSHARDFINNVATDIIHLTNQKLYYYKGVRKAELP